MTSLPTVLAHYDIVTAGPGGRVHRPGTRPECWNSHRLEALWTLKGSPPADLTARQPGYIAEAGTRHVSSRQPILEVGPDLPAGGLARAADTQELDALLDLYERAVR